jgi:hypothetical protein
VGFEGGLVMPFGQVKVQFSPWMWRSSFLKPGLFLEARPMGGLRVVADRAEQGNVPGEGHFDRLIQLIWLSQISAPHCRHRQALAILEVEVPHREHRKLHYGSAVAEEDWQA